jgi:hypothetical protein
MPVTDLFNAIRARIADLTRYPSRFRVAASFLPNRARRCLAADHSA